MREVYCHAGFAVRTNTAPGIVVEVDLATFTRCRSIILSPGATLLRSAVIDNTGTYAYFG